MQNGGSFVVPEANNAHSLQQQVDGLIRQLGNAQEELARCKARELILVEKIQELESLQRFPVANRVLFQPHDKRCALIPDFMKIFKDALRTRYPVISPQVQIEIYHGFSRHLIDVVKIIENPWDEQEAVGLHIILLEDCKQDTKIEFAPPKSVIGDARQTLKAKTDHSSSSKEYKQQEMENCISHEEIKTEDRDCRTREEEQFTQPLMSLERDWLDVNPQGPVQLGATGEEYWKTAKKYRKKQKKREKKMLKQAKKEQKRIEECMKRIAEPTQMIGAPQVEYSSASSWTPLVYPPPNMVPVPNYPPTFEQPRPTETYGFQPVYIPPYPSWPQNTFMQ